MTVTNALADALRNYQPKLDLVGPSVDDDIRRAITRYGAEAVKDSVNRQTKPKRGRKPEADWPELREVIVADAMDWLAGGDPFSTRSNYSIAKSFADKNTGQSHPATMKRIERKLAKLRVWATLATAEGLSWEGYPHRAHIRTLEALRKEYSHAGWGMRLERARSFIADYEAKLGAPPALELSMNEIEDAVRNALMPQNALMALLPRSQLEQFRTT